MMHRLVAWARSLLLRRRLEREMREEMEQHLERSIARLRGRGLSQAEAERSAHREFGNMDYIRETARDARGNRWIETIMADLRYALRQFARTPLSTAAMMLILSLGIGGTTALFAMVYSEQTHAGAGLQRDDRVVRIRGIGDTRLSSGRRLSYPEVAAYGEQTRVFTAIAAYHEDHVLLDFVGGDLRPARAHYVGPEYFKILNITPAVGAGLPSTVAPDNALVAVMSHALWQEQFGGSADVLGRVLHINDVPVTIVGVAPPHFAGVSGPGSRAELWLPLTARIPIAGSGPAFLSSIDSTQLYAIARLAAGASLRQATAVAGAVAARFEPASEREGSVSADVVPLREHNQRAGSEEDHLQSAAVLGVLCLIILLITCSNVSTLLTGMAATRRREIAVRLSLGAARGRVVRQLLVESAALALGAGLLAVLLLVAVLTFLGNRSEDLQLTIHWSAVVWTFGVSLVTALLFGLAPALYATRMSVSAVLKDAAAAVSGSRSLLQRALVVTQVAVTQPLLVGLAALLVGSAAELRGRSSPELHDRLAILSFNTYAGNVTPEQRKLELAAVRERLREMPGVVGAVPKGTATLIYKLTVHPADRVGGRGAETLDMRGEFAAPGYFALTGIPLLSGREFTEEDEDALIIGSDLARSLWGTTNVVGRRFVSPNAAGADSASLAVIGVVDDGYAGASDVSNRIRIFIHRDLIARAILVRTHTPAGPLIPQLRRASAEAAPTLPLPHVTTVAEKEAAARRFVLQVGSAAAAGGALALMLAALGLYAVIAQSVTQRRREIGIRTALGADHMRVSRLFFSGGLRLSLIGLVLGLPLSVLTLHVLTTQTGLPRTNLAAVSLLVAGAVITVASLASWLPARAAARVDPLQVLRLD